jgi:hypothetical protein
MGGGAPDIPQRDLGSELGSIIQFLPKFTQKTYGLARQYAPKFSGLDIKTLAKYAPQYAQLGYGLSKQFGPQYLGLNLGQMRADIAGQPLLKELNRQAQEQLGQQGRLTPQEAYQATQGSLTPFAGRNNVFNQAEATAFLNRDALIRQRRQEAQQFATGVQNLDLAQLAGLGGVINPPNFPAYGAPGAAFGPMQAGIGASSGISGQVIPFASDLFSSNQSAAANQAIGGANKTSGLVGAGVGAAGSIAAAAL